MRVVHFSCVAPPQIGGIGSVALREVTLLRARGVDAKLVVPELSEVGHESSVERSFVERVKPRWRFGNAANLPDLSALTKGADVIHLHYPFFGTAEPLLFKAGSLPPIVLTFHMDAVSPGWRGLVFGLHRLLLQSWLLEQPAKILVSSFDYARRSSLSGFFAAHPERVQELPFGVDTDFFSPGPAKRARFSVPEDAPVVLFVGGLDRAHAFKGVSQLLQAFSQLDQTAHLLIVGQGDLRHRYEEQARDLKIAERVHFLGRVDDETLRDAYRSADVFALPSTSSAEAFGLVALEAQACGLPVVASDLPGVRTVVMHGETGYLVPPKDVAALARMLERLLSDKNLRLTMRGRAQTLAHARFSWEKHVDDLTKIYREVCASRS